MTKHEHKVFWTGTAFCALAGLMIGFFAAMPSPFTEGEFVWKYLFGVPFGLATTWQIGHFCYVLTKPEDADDE